MDTQAIARAAAVWRDCGVQPGEAVAVGLANHAEARLACLGVTSAGGVAIVIDAALPVARLEGLWKQGGWRFLLAESRADRPAAMRDSILTRSEWLRALDDPCLRAGAGATIGP